MKDFIVQRIKAYCDEYHGDDPDYKEKLTISFKHIMPDMIWVPGGR